MRRFVRLVGAAAVGAGARCVEVQVALREEKDSRQRTFRIVGLPDSALREGTERIRSAITHAGWRWPLDAIVVNLAPAAARKAGAALDLPIALGILAGSGALARQLPPSEEGAAGRFCFAPKLEEWLCVGELGLDGRLRPVRGVLAAVEAARARGATRALVPEANAVEAAAAGGLEVFAATDLAAAAAHLTGEERLPPVSSETWKPVPPRPESGAAIRGQNAARRAAWVAAAGNHNMLLTGPPGSGKTLIARHTVALMPELSREEAVEVSRLHSAAGLLDGGLVRARPFRAPHHTTSMAGLVGGGREIGPGELSLAHLGVLFLDELPEYPRAVLEALRTPLEDGHLVLGRASGRLRLPSEVLLVAAMNPCPCGHAGSDRCRCPPQTIHRYQSRISGPMRDRFDLQVTVRPVDAARMVGEADAAPYTIKQLLACQRRQLARQHRWRLPRPWNGRLPARVLPEAVEPTEEAIGLLVQQGRRLGLSARGMHRALRVARTLADLDASVTVERSHLLDALQYRDGIRT